MGVSVRKILFIIMVSNFMIASAASEVLLKDIGVIGLASHDLFTWDRENEVNTENGRLDLSTIFDYENGSRWEKGGNPKNAENAPVWSITKRLVQFYKSELSINNKTQARINTVKYFHQMIKESYVRLSGLEFPSFAVDENVTNTEQAVLRALHDILPGKAKIYRRFFPVKEFKLTNFLFAKFYLNEKELNQKIAYFNGDYDQEYKEIKIPFTRRVINLKEVDGAFIEKFSEYNQARMLAELKRVGDGDITISEVYFIHHVKELFQKGLCSKNNKWIQNNLICN
tara:strand:+ start:261360 stop:262211 length:852 start_codon:yes stop_codon:yes gene_type:complete